VAFALLARSLTAKSAKHFAKNPKENLADNLNSDFGKGSIKNSFRLAPHSYLQSKLFSNL
jgi:hypothetical protein